VFLGNGKRETELAGEFSLKTPPPYTLIVPETTITIKYGNSPITRKRKLAWGAKVLPEKSIDELQPQKLEKNTDFLLNIILDF
jgi:hypothetical protein